MTRDAVAFELEFIPTPDSEPVMVMADELLGIEMTTTGRFHVTYRTPDGIKKERFFESVRRVEESR